MKVDLAAPMARFTRELQSGVDAKRRVPLLPIAEETAQFRVLVHGGLDGDSMMSLHPLQQHEQLHQRRLYIHKNRKFNQ